MDFDPFIYIELILNGILVGTVYGLIACGLSLIFGVGKIVNFAHGALLALGMFLVYWLQRSLGVNVYIVILPAAFLMFWLGYGFQQVLIKPILLREKGIPVLPVILLTAGVMMVLENFLLLVFGSSYLTLKMDWAQSTFRIGDMSFPLVRLIAFFSALVVVAILNIFLGRTDIGRAIRAVSQDREKARLLGIDDQRILCVTVGLGAAITTIAGGTLLPFYYVHPDIGNMFLTKCFVIVVLGGLGTISGALAGGVIVGVLEVVMAQFMKVSVVQGLIFLIFVLVLLIKPSGLLGTERE
jgi:branched-chain amino acid transport system permease protein